MVQKINFCKTIFPDSQFSAVVAIWWLHMNFQNSKFLGQSMFGTKLWTSAPNVNLNLFSVILRLKELFLGL